MKLFPGQSRQPRDAFSFLFHLTCVSLATAADTCSPWTWTNEAARTAAPAARPEPTVTFVPAGSHVANMIAAVRPVATAGELVCRYPGRTNADVNYYTCTQLANKYGITIEKFFMLNPGLDPDCGNIQPNTMYCLAGCKSSAAILDSKIKSLAYRPIADIEPLRAYDGKCGPPNNNATCLGTNAQCCNSKTWTCGKSE